MVSDAKQLTKSQMEQLKEINDSSARRSPEDFSRKVAQHKRDMENDLATMLKRGIDFAQSDDQLAEILGVDAKAVARCRAATDREPPMNCRETNTSEPSIAGIGEVFAFDDRLLHVCGNAEMPWFSYSDLCEILDIYYPQRAAAALDPDEMIVSQEVAPDTGVRVVTFVNLSGLYSLTMRSWVPEAKRFQKVITCEVLPTIRRYGLRYTPLRQSKFLNSPDPAGRSTKGRKIKREDRIRAVPSTAKVKSRIQLLLAADPQLAEYALLGLEMAYDRDTFAIRHIAQNLGTTGRQLNGFLEDMGVIYRHGRSWYTRAKYTGSGHFRCCTYIKRSGEEEDYLRAYGKGIHLIHQLWRKHSEAWLAAGRHKMTYRQRNEERFERRRRRDVKGNAP